MRSEATLQSLVRSFPERGHEMAVIAFDERGQDTWSYEKLSDAIARFSTGLLDAGVKRGQPVFIMAPNSPAWIIVYFGIISAGAMAVPVDNLLGDADAARLLQASNAGMAFVGQDHLAALRKSDGAANIQFFLLDSGREHDEVPGWQSLLATEVREGPIASEDETASRLFTSGTTGPPKTVPLTHRNFFSNVTALRHASIVGPGDRVLLPLPLHHAYAFTVGLLGTLSNGGTLVLPAGASGPALQQALKEGKATTLLAVPRLLEALIEAVEARIALQGRRRLRLFRRLLTLSISLRRIFGIRIGRILFRQLHEGLGPELRLIGSGGARLDPETAWKLEGLGWQVLSGYGLTETSPILTLNLAGQNRIGTAGRPVPGVEIRIDAEPGSPEGEICARGPNVFAGYLNNPEANKTAFTADGWFRTGDIGFVDGAGYLHIVGRAKEMIVLASGKNIAPEEIEGTFEQCPLFQEVAVMELEGVLVGIFVPDYEALRAYGAAQASVLLRDEIEQISVALPKYERLSDFRVIHEDLPRTHLGKLKRHQLLSIWEQAAAAAPPQRAELSDADKELISAPPASDVWEWLAQRFQGKALSLDASFQLDLGLDSLAWVNLTLELQESFGILLSDEAISRIVTVRDLLMEVEEAAKTRGGRPSVEAALTPQQKRWLAPPGPFKEGISMLVYGLLWFCMRALFRLSISGVGSLPRSGAFLIAPSHASSLDPLAINAALPWRLARRTWWAGWAGHFFSSRLRRFLSHSVRLFAVDPDRRPMATLAAGIALLSRGEILVWFPEGERARTPEILPFRAGIGMLIKRTGAPVVPVLVSGSFEALPRDRLVPRLRPISIAFGEPKTAEQLLAGGQGETAEARIADGLRNSVLALRDQEQE